MGTEIAIVVLYGTNTTHTAEYHLSHPTYGARIPIQYVSRITNSHKKLRHIISQPKKKTLLTNRCRRTDTRTDVDTMTGDELAPAVQPDTCAKERATAGNASVLKAALFVLAPFAIAILWYTVCTYVHCDSFRPTKWYSE